MPELPDKIYHAVIIGAGLAGVATGIALKKAGIDDFIIAEKTNGLSGTWYDNHYPGAACDVPSMLYSYSFAPNPDWSRRFAPHYEIRTYVEKVIKSHDLDRHIRLGTEIIAGDFDPKNALWHLKTKSGDTISARYLITSVAILGTPKYPDIKGIKSFAGQAFHSARWDNNVELKGKKIALIGNAASALQIAPEIAKTAKNVTIFQRTANWIVPRMDRKYSKFETAMFKRFPWTMRVPRWALFIYLEFIFYRVFTGKGLINALYTHNANAYRAKKIKDKQLRDKLTPDYPIGCKRVLLSDDYYDTINRDNVELVTDAIEQITPDGILLKTGRQIDTDILVFATGFTATDFMPNLNLTGLGGATLADWRTSPKAHKGLTLENMPNAFFLLGPNTGLGHASMILMMEAQIPHMMKIIKAVKPGQYFTVKPQALAKFNARIQNKMQHSIWVTSCQSWYKTDDGHVPTLWPYPTYTYKNMMRATGLDDYEIST